MVIRSEERPTIEDQERMLALFKLRTSADTVAEKTKIPFITVYKYFEAYKMGFRSPEEHERHIRDVLNTPINELEDLGTKFRNFKKQEGKPDLKTGSQTIQKTFREGRNDSQMNQISILRNSRMDLEERKRKVLSRLMELKKIGINPSATYDPDLTWKAKGAFGTFNGAKEAAGLATYKWRRDLKGSIGILRDEVKNILQEGPLSFGGVIKKLDEKGLVYERHNLSISLQDGEIGRVGHQKLVYYLTKNGSEDARKFVEKEWLDKYETYPLSILDQPRPLSQLKEKGVNQEVIDHLRRSNKITVLDRPKLNPFWHEGSSGRFLLDDTEYVVKIGQEREFMKSILEELYDGREIGNRGVNGLYSYFKYEEGMRNALVQVLHGDEYGRLILEKYFEKKDSLIRKVRNFLDGNPSTKDEIEKFLKKNGASLNSSAFPGMVCRGLVENSGGKPWVYYLPNEDKGKILLKVEETLIKSEDSALKKFDRPIATSQLRKLVGYKMFRKLADKGKVTLVLKPVLRERMRGEEKIFTFQNSPKYALKRGDEEILVRTVLKELEQAGQLNYDNLRSVYKKLSIYPTMLDAIQKVYPSEYFERLKNEQPVIRKSRVSKSEPQLIWTKEELRDALTKLKNVGINPTKKSHPEIYKTSRKLFGSWEVMKKDLGFLWTKEKVRQELQNLKNNNINPSSANYCGLAGASRRFYKSWSEAKVSVGLEPLYNIQRKYSAGDILDVLRKHRDGGKNPTYDELPGVKDAARKIFGSLNIAKEFIGMKTNSRSGKLPEHDIIKNYLKGNPSTSVQVRNYMKKMGYNMHDGYVESVLHTKDVARIGGRKNTIYYIEEEGITEARKILDQRWRHQAHKKGTFQPDFPELLTGLLKTPKTTKYLKENGVNYTHLENMQVAGNLIILKRPVPSTNSKYPHDSFRPGQRYAVPIGQEKKFLQSVIREAKRAGFGYKRIITGLRYYLKGIYDMENALSAIRVYKK